MTEFFLIGFFMLHALSVYIYFRNILVSKRIQSKTLFISGMLFEISFTIMFIWSLYQESSLDINVTTLFDYPVLTVLVLLVAAVIPVTAGMIALEKEVLKLKKLGLSVVFASLVQAVLFIFICLSIWTKY
jgi:hypothetical protein